KNGDMFIQKAPAATIGDIASALIELYRSKSKIKIIGTRHGEKLYETLVNREEMARAMDLGGYYRVPADNRGLNYEDYFTEGEKRVSKIEDYHSHNTKRLTLGETKQLLLKLTLIQNDNIENLGIKDNQWQNQN
ncbi:MAG: polysaccharide biosynthesis protein, partial [Bacteroidetes bacterium]|nr:polysaccharide biosynthesis protein [Bacteroidota bacterium]